jgi:hypothetical protein
MPVFVIARELWWTNQKRLDIRLGAQRMRNGRCARVAMWAKTTRLKDQGWCFNNDCEFNILSICIMCDIQAKFVYLNTNKNGL